MDIINEIQNIDAKIRFLNSEIKNAEALMTLAGINYSEISKTGPIDSKLENKIVEILDKYDKLKSLILIQEKLHEKLWLILESINIKEAYEVVSLTINDRLSASEIAERLRYSPRHIRRILEQVREYSNSLCNNPTYVVALNEAIINGISVNEVLKEKAPDFYEMNVKYGTMS